MFKAGKYKAKPVDGFPSRLEKAVYDILLVREKVGEIKNIKRQVQVYLTDAKILYKPDFSYEEKATNKTIFVEAKGLETPTWRIKKRLWKHYGPGRLQIYMGNYRFPKLVEELIPIL